VKQRKHFPSHFLWGASTAAHQIEGNNIHSDWWQWEQAGKIGQGVKSGQACNSYQLWKQDHRWLEKLHLNAYRFSISWARIEPEEGNFNLEAIKHYKLILQDLRKRKITSFLSLHHLVNPAWFTRKGGWEKQQNIHYFIRFVEKIAHQLGDLVDYWSTINEPLTIVGQGFLLGNHVPRKRNPLLAIRVLNNLITAHLQAYQKLHQLLPNPQVGFAVQLIKFEPQNHTKFWQNQFAKTLHHWHNLRFINRILPHVDFIGINYYTRTRIYWNWQWWRDFLTGQSLKPLVHSATFRAGTMGWEVYPQGLYWAIKQASKWHQPIFITENGYEGPDDLLREKYISEHLRNLHRAISEGVDVRGYFHWSLIDNFEWDWGYKPKFGLLSFDPKTFARKAKSSAWFYKKIASSNALPKE
jgi:beta-glucosidase